MDDAVTEVGASRPSSPVPPLPELPSSRPTYRFTWDPALRRPGPGSVSEATDNRTDHFASPRGDLFPLNNASSLSLALPHDWSSSKHGFNAISTVLNNPHRRAAPPKAHSSLPAVAAAELPRVRRKDFEPYLTSVTPEWERFERSSQLGREGAAQLEPPDPPQALSSSSALSPGPLTPDFPHTPRTALPAHGKALPPLDMVPAIYFDAAFDLGDPETFARVTESAGAGDDPAAVAHALPLLEKLSHYADVVEQHLVREIARRSTAFFAALANLHDLQTEAAACLARIARLRGVLRAVDARTARRGLEMVRLEARRANVARVRAGARAVRDAADTLGAARALVQGGAWGDALGVVAGLRAGAAPPAGLRAFAALPAQLRALTAEVAGALAADARAVLRADLRERAARRGGGGARADELLRDRLKPLVQGLVRAQGVRAALAGWREVALAEVRGAVKRHLPADVDDEDDARKTLTERSASLAKELREMAHDDFIKLARQIYAGLLRCVHGVHAQSQIVAELLESISAEERAGVEAELGDTLASACELANARAAKVLAARAEAHAQLALREFHALFAATWDFVLACEVLCRRMIVGLRGAAVAQAKAFLGAFHAARTAAAAKLVEDEQWAQADVPAALQRTAALLVDAAMQDPAAFVLPRPEPLDAAGAGEDEEGAGEVQRPLSPPSTPPQGTPPPVAEEEEEAAGKQLRIEERAYFAVGATLQVLVVLLADYVRLIVNLPLLTTDAMGRVIEFLKAFNSRTCQVVLGAGAMRSAGLKNITAKHLALASQSLSIGVALVPYVRETFRRHLSATQAVMLVEFDKLKRDLQEHQHEIHAKLVVIMGDRLGVHCRTLQDVKWEEAPAKAGPNAYMEVLVKETVTLHKVLTRYLGAPTVELVMTQVLAAINHRLSEEYGKIELGSQAAKDRLLLDARFLQERLGSLRHVGGRGGMLETVVQEMRVGGAGAGAGAAGAGTAGAGAGAGAGRGLSERMAAVVAAGARRDAGGTAGQGPGAGPSGGDGSRDREDHG